MTGKPVEPRLLLPTPVRHGPCYRPQLMRPDDKSMRIIPTNR
jgi:hypothetical protein